MRRNILITSAGRRAKLLTIFQRELAALVPGGRVFAADTCPSTSVACRLAERSFAVSPVDESGHGEELLDLCISNDVGLVVPTTDRELPVLAAGREAFAAAGVMAAVSEPGFISVCRDKRQTAQWFVGRGLRSPRVFAGVGAARFPLFTKPVDGSNSQGARVIWQRAELAPALAADPRVMFVEYLSPAEHDEYTLDMYYCRQSRLRCCVPRLRLEVRGGEVTKSRTCRLSALQPLERAVAHVAGARGCITTQVFIHRHSQEVYGIEINARFGGGYPLSYEAGANFPRWLIQEYLLEQAVEFYDAWENDLTMLRYDEHVVLRAAAA